MDSICILGLRESRITPMFLVCTVGSKEVIFIQARKLGGG